MNKRRILYSGCRTARHCLDATHLSGRCVHGGCSSRAGGGCECQRTEGDDATKPHHPHALQSTTRSCSRIGSVCAALSESVRLPAPHEMPRGPWAPSSASTQCDGRFIRVGRSADDRTLLPDTESTKRRPVRPVHWVRGGVGRQHPAAWKERHADEEDAADAESIDRVLTSVRCGATRRQAGAHPREEAQWRADVLRWELLLLRAREPVERAEAAGKASGMLRWVPGLRDDAGGF